MIINTLKQNEKIWKLNRLTSISDFIYANESISVVLKHQNTELAVSIIPTGD